jgi:hypothetical protein
MKYLKLNTDQKELLDSITATNNSNNVLSAFKINETDDFFVLQEEVKYEPMYAHYLPLLNTLETIEL